uniref:OCIA domain-containing protein 1 n=1 Tax=Cyprinus carpio TaxID=7962 RepID=A0A8C2JRT4_CYPCA
MPQQSPADPERPGNAVVGPVGIDYIPTEEERRVFRECNQESFWYRSLPISAISMAFTQFLISRGALMASGRFGSWPKVAFAGVFGYLGGKMSYMKTCQEKFKSLENSPLGEALRQRQPDFELDQRNQPFSYSSDFTYSDPMPSAAQCDTQITGMLTHLPQNILLYAYLNMQYIKIKNRASTIKQTNQKLSFILSSSIVFINTFEQKAEKIAFLSNTTSGSYSVRKMQ